MKPVKEGVVDRFEGDLAVVVLDDDQQVRWPLTALPPGCRPGTAVRLQLVTGAADVVARRSDGAEPAAHAEAGARLPVRVRPSGQAAEWKLQLDDGSTLTWPVSGRLPVAVTGPFSLVLTPDADDTAARRRRVSGLVDDIFGASGR